MLINEGQRNKTSTMPKVPEAINPLKPGDKIKITNYFGGVTIVEIERVTKLKAISQPYNDAGARYEFKLSTQYGVKPYSPQRWSTTKYELIN